MKLHRPFILVLLALAASGCGRAPGPTLAGGKPIEQWLHSINDGDEKARKQAVEKLGNVGGSDPAVVSALCEALQDRSAEVRCAAIMALMKCGPAAKESREALKTMGQKDDDPRVRDYAAQAVEKLEQ